MTKIFVEVLSLISIAVVSAAALILIGLAQNV